MTPHDESPQAPAQPSLGERIRELRASRALSQWDVAEALDVSRQSVSKWENDLAVPELSKLIGLANLFGVTLDELARGASSAQSEEKAVPPDDPVQTADSTGEAAETGSHDKGVDPSAVLKDPDPTPMQPPRTEPLPRQDLKKIIGVILLCAGAVLLLLLLALGGGVYSLQFALPFLLCGVVCLTVRRRTGLFCGWAVYFSLDLYFSFSTILRRSTVLHLLFYAAVGEVHLPEFLQTLNPLEIPLSCVSLLILLLLAVLTVRGFRTLRLPTGKRTVVPLCCCAGAALLVTILSGPVSSALLTAANRSEIALRSLLFTAAEAVSFAFSWIRIAALVTAAVLALARFRKRKESQAA